MNWKLLVKCPLHSFRCRPVVSKKKNTQTCNENHNKKGFVSYLNADADDNIDDNEVEGREKGPSINKRRRKGRSMKYHHHNNNKTRQEGPLFGRFNNSLT